jgi:hypothetical protein
MPTGLRRGGKVAQITPSKFFIILENLEVADSANMTFYEQTGIYYIPIRALTTVAAAEKFQHSTGIPREQFTVSNRLINYWIK